MGDVSLTAGYVCARASAWPHAVSNKGLVGRSPAGVNTGVSMRLAFRSHQHRKDALENRFRGIGGSQNER